MSVPTATQFLTPFPQLFPNFLSNFLVASKPDEVYNLDN